MYFTKTNKNVSPAAIVSFAQLYIGKPTVVPGDKEGKKYEFVR